MALGFEPTASSSLGQRGPCHHPRRAFRLTYRIMPVRASRPA
ncbi:MAG: hypothetical protein AVDCRST_MAG87-2255 [uncultured Thermomicrobiales bacterium]|uniref:Uncharacterized protein n=1 Tax=uncultured Thermomicrobiales bacterium TaxID=1645740 RepID=A0A6J4V5N4_9BACT|nr:MAG: hypothetical protein AVDCRST_MAG87-2255 [uncultured Thermomicrobiales bacterium]